MIIWTKLYHDWHIFSDKVQYSFTQAFEPLYVKIYLIALFGINATLWFFTWLFYKQVKGDLIILHYNVDFGVDLIDQPKKLFIIPALGLFCLILNFLLILFFTKDKNFKVVANILLGAAMLVNIFLALSVGPIYLINFS